MSLVGQEPVLFDRTVEENIAYGLSDTPPSAVVQAAIKANAHDFISTLPEQYQTCNYPPRVLLLVSPDFGRWSTARTLPLSE